MSMIAVSPSIGPVRVDVMLKQAPSRHLQKTRIPVETGANITDHAHLSPQECELEFVDSNGAGTWAALAALQDSRQPFTLVTGLSVMRNMLIMDMEAERTDEYSQVIKGRVRLEEIILAGSGSIAAGGLGGLGGLSGGALGSVGGLFGALGGALDTGLGAALGSTLPTVIPGLPGGVGSITAATPLPAIVSDVVTLGRVAETVVRGGNPVTRIDPTGGVASGILSDVFGNA